MREARLAREAEERDRSLEAQVRTENAQAELMRQFAEELKSLGVLVRGKDGAPGERGTDGNHGKDGAPGERGADGTNGRDGIDGAPGANGRDGRDGIDGAPGVMGPRGLMGPAAPTVQRSVFARDDSQRIAGVVEYLSDGTERTFTVQRDATGRPIGMEITHNGS